MAPNCSDEKVKIISLWNSGRYKNVTQLAKVVKRSRRTVNNIKDDG